MTTPDYDQVLAREDPELRRKRGVYFTPESLAYHVVHQVDHFLRRDFDIPGGFANLGVEILEPAAGSGNFLTTIIRRIYQEFVFDHEVWREYVPRHLLPRLTGIELLPGACDAARRKLRALFEELHCPLPLDAFLPIIQADTISEPLDCSEPDAWNRWLRSRKKRSAPKLPLVIIGNPPWSGLPSNQGPWIKALLRGKDVVTGEEFENYYHIDGNPSGEKNLRGLSDDYVRFLRYAHWRIERRGLGILAFITPAGLLNNFSLAGARQSLLETFDKIYVIADSGSPAKGGKTLGEVLGVKVRVAISIFIKSP
ncbi:MAG: hypothetical protein FVQ81_13080 [Candidatus Glassbacteria bacterium]|nr:hypothetical protein [Candidatus Glassbacteria bacterium]